MKKFIYLLLLLSQPFWGQSGFQKGNQLYQKGNYEKAIVAYESILKSGQESSDLYYNLGNSYYKLNKAAPAIFNFEKALLLNPNDSKIINNLAFAHKMTVDEVVAIPKVGFSKIVEDFTMLFHYDTWAWLAIIAAFVFLISFLGYYLMDKVLLKRLFFSSMIFLVLFIIVAFFAGFNQKEKLELERPAIVFDDATTVKSEPKSNAQDAFVLHAGTKVYVLETFEDFKKIQLLDLKQGWIQSKSIKEIK